MSGKPTKRRRIAKGKFGLNWKHGDIYVEGEKIDIEESEASIQQQPPADEAKTSQNAQDEAKKAEASKLTTEIETLSARHMVLQARMDARCKARDDRPFPYKVFRDGFFGWIPKQSEMDDEADYAEQRMNQDRIDKLLRQKRTIESSIDSSANSSNSTVSSSSPAPSPQQCKQ